MSWKRPVFALFSFLLFFGVLEAILWIAGVPTLLAERDPFAGFSRQVRVFELDSKRNVYHTSPRAVRHSFNYQEFAAVKPANGFRFFVLGGSSAYGFPWGAEVAYSRALGDALRADWRDRRIEDVNAAAMSYGSHRLRILAGEILDYHPEVLVVDGGHNEFVERRFYSDLLSRQPRLDAPRKLLFRSRLYSLLARSYEKLRTQEPGERTMGEMLGIDVNRQYSLEVGEGERAQARAQFEENLRAILDMAQGAGVRVVLCTAPSNLSGWLPNQSFFDPSVSVDDRETVLAGLAEARGLAQNGEAAAALTILERARELAPGHAEVHFRLGEAYEALGRWDDARAAFVRARDLDGKPSRAIGAINATIRSLAAERNVLLVDVERTFENASPHGLVGFNLFEDYVHPKPHGHRLIALELWKVFEENGLLGERRAADPQAFWRALSAEPAIPADDDDRPLAATEAKSAPLLFNLAVVLENQGRSTEALDKYRACLELDPHYVAARNNLGRLLHLAGRFAEAAAEYTRALKTQPDNLKSLIGLAEALRRMDRTAEALEVLGRATAIDPRSAPAWDALGGALAQQNRHAEAESAYRRAAALDPKSADVRANLGFTLLFQKKVDDARASFREGLTLQPEHARCRNGLGAVLTESGQLDEAERIFRENLRRDPRDNFARGALEVIAARRGA